MPCSATTFSATCCDRLSSRTPRYTTLLKPRPITSLRWKLYGPMRFLSGREGAQGCFGTQSLLFSELSVSRPAFAHYSAHSVSSVCML